MVVVTYYREAIVNNHPPLVAVEASTGFSMVGVPDPFSSRPNIKEEKVVWLRETALYGSHCPSHEFTGSEKVALEKQTSQPSLIMAV